jgi:hypothetical protein
MLRDPSFTFLQAGLGDSRSIVLYEKNEHEWPTGLGR